MILDPDKLFLVIKGFILLTWRLTIGSEDVKSGIE